MIKQWFDNVFINQVYQSNYIIAQQNYIIGDPVIRIVSKIHKINIIGSKKIQEQNKLSFRN